MKKKLLISALVLMVIVSLTMIASFTMISAEGARELPKAENLTAEEFIEVCKSGSAKAVKDLLAEKKLSPNVQLKWAKSNDSYSPLLFLAVRESTNTNIIQTLIDLGADIHIQNDDVFNKAADSVSPDIMVPFFLKQGFDPNIKDEFGCPALIRVASNINDDEGLALSAMIEAGVNVNAQDEAKGTIYSGQTALMAARRGKIIKKLLDAGADVNIKNQAGENALFEAVLGDEEGVHLLLQAGADPNASNNNGATVLIHAAEHNVSVGKIKLLLSAGADINARMNDGTTALINTQNGIYGVWANNFELLKVLIDAGADVNAQKDDGTTALMLACASHGFGHYDVLVKILIEAGANVNAKTKDGLTALINAAGVKGDGTVNPVLPILLEAGADINAAMNDGTTALLNAAKNGQEKNFEELAKAGANATLLNSKTSLIWVANNARLPMKKIIKELINSGADVNATDNEGNTALIALIKNYEPGQYTRQYNYITDISDVIGYLFEAGADVNAQNDEGMTALMYATSADIQMAVLRLLAEGANPDIKAKDGTVAKIEPQKLFESLKTIIRGINLGMGDLGSSANYARVTRELIRAGLDINARDEEGWPLLFMAVVNGDMGAQAVKGLIEGGANVNVTGGKANITTIMQAVMDGSLNIIQILADNGANLEVRDSEGETPLFLAIREGKFTTVNTLIRNGANVNARNNKGITALITACINENAQKNPQILRELLDAGANVNARDDQLGATALIITSAVGNSPEIIRALLEAGADPNLTSNENGRAIDYIRHNDKLNRTEAVDMLLNAMNSSNRLNSSQTAPRSNSSSAANIDVFKLAKNGTLQELQDAVAKGAKFNVTRGLDDGNEDTELFLVDESPLHIAAAFNQNQGVIKFLVSQGLNVNAYASNGGTGSSPLGNPLSCAVRHKNLNTVRELLEAGADPNSDSYDGYSSSGNPIAIVALEYEDNPLAQTVITSLVKAGSDVNGDDKHDVSAEFKRAYLLPRSQWSSSDFRENMTDVSNVDLSYFYGSSTPLMYAVLLGKPNIANTLLDFNANPNIYNAENKLALDYANEAPDYSTIKNSPVFNRLKNATTVASKAIKSDPDFDRADMLVAQGKIPMYVRDKGIFVYNPKMKMVRITGNNVRLRSQPNMEARVVARGDREMWGAIEYLGEWTHPNGDKWIIGLYDDWNYHPEPTPEEDKKIIWVSAKYAKPVTMQEWHNWADSFFVPD